MKRVMKRKLTRKVIRIKFKRACWRLFANRFKLCKISTAAHVFLPAVISITGTGSNVVPDQVASLPFSSGEVREVPDYTELIDRFDDELDSVLRGSKDYEEYLESVSRHYSISLPDIRVLAEDYFSNNLDADIETGFQQFIERGMKDGSITSDMEKPKEEKKTVRLTSYQYTPNGSDDSLGGSLGKIAPYLRDGSIYYDQNGFAIFRGGTKSKLNGKVYGKKGEKYLIVATATPYLIGDNYKRNDKIKYHEYNDTFDMKITTKNGTTKYKVIVLDSCGASMDWSTTSKGTYAPETEKEREYCKRTNNTKIDVFTAPKGYSRLANPNDTASIVKVTEPELPNIDSLTSDAEKYIEVSYERTNHPHYEKVKAIRK